MSTRGRRLHRPLYAVGACMCVDQAGRAILLHIVFNHAAGGPEVSSVDEAA